MFSQPVLPLRKHAQGNPTAVRDVSVVPEGLEPPTL